jgi:hypothetical protein
VVPSLTTTGKSVRTQVSPPDERSPGVIIEARYHTANGELRLDLDGKLYAEALGPNDDPLMVARSLLRQKYGRHDEFLRPHQLPAAQLH